MADDISRCSGWQRQDALIDSFGRHIAYLRLSVTDRCDLRCTYCMAEKMRFLPRKELLSLEELERIALIFIDRGVRKLRITGGEPLVRKDVLGLFEQLGKRLGNGLDELGLTSNATCLASHAEGLFRAGVKRVNVSLDSLDPQRFAEITRGGRLEKVLAGIETALQTGLRIKINTVVLAGGNAEDIPQMVEWAHERGMDMTLIEVMPLGETGEDRFDQYVPLTEIRQQLETRWDLQEITITEANAGPARYVRVAHTGGRLGFITPLSNNFCAGCNRVRLTCTGRLYMCLGQDAHIDLRDLARAHPNDDAPIHAAIDRALATKPERHDFSISQRGQAPALPRHMSTTGG